MPLNEYAKRWVKALRSGEYEQGHGRLRTFNNFCCLGVACDVLKEELEADWYYDHDGIYDFLDEVKDLPLKAIEILGLDFRGDHSHYFCLANMNDRGKSFSEIADFIESEPEGLFKEESKVGIL